MYVERKGEKQSAYRTRPDQDFTTQPLSRDAINKIIATTISFAQGLKASVCLIFIDISKTTDRIFKSHRTEVLNLCMKTSFIINRKKRFWSQSILAIEIKHFPSR